MTQRELVYSALEHRETRPIPCQVDFTGQEYEKVAAYFGDRNFMKNYESCMAACLYSGRTREIPGRPGFFVDDYGVVWNRTGVDKDIGVIEKPLISNLEESTYRLPELDEKLLRWEMDELMRRREDRFVLAGVGFSMFERAWTLCSMEEVLAAMLLCPEALDGLLDQICEYHLAMIRIMLEYDVDGIYFGDDWGQQKGLIMGAPHWRRFIKPRMARLYGEVKQAGKFVFQHSCGDIHEIFPDLIDIGLDCYQTFQPEIYDIAAIKEEFGSKLSFWGAISTQHLLPFADVETVRSETIRIMRILGKSGGYIAAPTHAVPGDVPPENIEAMLDVFHNQERYL
jgi:uroporphyrinogen decarboxylase